MIAKPYANMRKDWSMADSTEQARRAECYDDLLASLKLVVAELKWLGAHRNPISDSLMTKANAAIFKATGAPA